MRRRGRHRGAGGQPRRLQHLARGRRAPGGRAAAAAARPSDETANIVAHPERVQAQELPPRRRLGGHGELHGPPNLGLHAARGRPEPQLRRLLGRPRRIGRGHAHTSSTAQDYRGPGPFSEPETRNIRKLVSKRPGDDVDHQPHLLEPGAAPARASNRGPTPPDEKALQALGDRMAQGERLHEPGRIRALRHIRRRPRTGATTRPAATATRSRSAPTLSTRRSRDVIAEYRGTTTPRARAAATAPPICSRPAQRRHRSSHSLISGEAPPGARLSPQEEFKTQTSPVIDSTGAEGDMIKLPEKLRRRSRRPAPGTTTGT